MPIWLFENQNFHEAWVPFDRTNQRKLEYVFMHHDALVRHLLEKTPVDTSDNNVDKDEQDPSAIDLVKLNKPDDDDEHNTNDDGHALSIVLTDSHFREPITVYPHMLLGCLPDRDILVARTEHSDDLDKIKSKP